MSPCLSGLSSCPRMTEIMAVVTEVEDGVNRGHGLGHTETTACYRPMLRASNKINNFTISQKYYRPQMLNTQQMALNKC